MNQPVKSNREHSFDWELATIVGIEKAVLLKNISYWCDENRRRAVEGYFIHGIWWTSESLRSLAFKYPYFTKPSISRWMNELNAAHWIRMLGQTGGQNYYAPGEVFTAWETGDDWETIQKRVVSQNETPPKLSQNETPPSQNETVGVSKRDTGCLKMRHTNIEILKGNLDKNARRARAGKQSQISSKKSDTKSPPVAPAPPRSELFSESNWAKATFQDWQTSLAAALPNIPDLDHSWYLNRVKDWSAEKGATSLDWISTAAKFARDDQRKNKLVTIQPATNEQHSIPNSSSTGTKRSFKLTTTREDVIDVAERVLARRSRRTGYGAGNG